MPPKVFEYEVIDCIGTGAGSSIYVVSQEQTQQLYALKHVIKRNEKDARFIEQLENEYEISRRFNHPALRRSIEMRDDKTMFHKANQAALVMELFDGQALDSRPRGDVLETIAIFVQVARGLAALHAMGYAHCDLKPNNILVNAEREVKIIDFGQACRLGSVKGRIQGTPDFIAPEQVRREPITARTDVFNFGATLYAGLTGRNIPTLYTVKKGDNSFLVDDAIPSPREIEPEVPEQISNLVMECVRTNPTQRPEMGELIRRLEVLEFSAKRRAAVA
ncbi:MAG TPA: serine/threonine-protein kinase [Tepidisphaeraceae bacterium]|nr:serine/threonine-protein kinase [Tepidisphaeraceae bacterium]